MQEHPLEVFYKKAVVKNLAIFTEKSLYWSLYLIQNITKFFDSTCFQENLRIAAAEKCLEFVHETEKNLKQFLKNFKFILY